MTVLGAMTLVLALALPAVTALCPIWAGGAMFIAFVPCLFFWLQETK